MKEYLARCTFVICAAALFGISVLTVPAQTNPATNQGRSAFLRSSKTVTKTAPKALLVSFLNEVEPILTRYGCNRGACHGTQFGKGGFKLSLAGYDPDLDYENIVRASGGRRISPERPEDSLLLRKPSLAIAHAGGLALRKSSADFATLRTWIRQDAPKPNPADPRPVSIGVNTNPFERDEYGGKQLHVFASFSDGTQREVTSHARIESLSEQIASCTPDGFVKLKAPGATGIMVRYSGLATIWPVANPYLNRPAVLAKGWANWHAASPIDRLTENAWRRLSLAPSPLCDDATFLRRVSLDLTGTLPTPDEARGWLSDRTADKRARLIDELLERPEYADYWAQRWADILRNSRSTLGERGMWQFQRWLREQFAENRPFVQVAQKLITASGDTTAIGPANYYRVVTQPNELAETTAQVFLGVRMQCAKCHHHPFERWSQDDYYHLAAFFARVNVVGGKTPAEAALVRDLPSGEVRHPKSGRQMQPVALGADPGATPGVDRRTALADWLAGPGKTDFAKSVVNRYWGALFGRGLIDPVDDIRVTNPPSNPALLTHLTTQFVRDGYDLKALLRSICNSRVYQLSSERKPWNAQDDTLQTHFALKRMPAEVLLDAVSSATGAPSVFEKLPAGTRAISLPDPSIASPFLDVFGRPQRASQCECERVSQPDLSQAMQMLNGKPVAAQIASNSGRAAALAKSTMTLSQIVEELYLSTLTRYPSAKETRIATGLLQEAPDRRKAIEDVLWALMNGNEFLFVR